MFAPAHRGATFQRCSAIGTASFGGSAVGKKGVWQRIFEAMSDDPDFEYLIIDSTIVRAHQHAAGAKKGGLKIRPLAAPAAA